MDSYIIRIYRRDSNNQPLAGIIEPVGNNLNSLKSNPFNDPEKLWTLLSLPNKPGTSGPKKNQNSRKK
jgi:hypothetical protein